MSFSTRAPVKRDIWYDDLLATGPLPDLLVRPDVDEVRQLRPTCAPERDIDTALSKLLRHYERLPRLQRALHKELIQGEGRTLWRDYLAWEKADTLRSRDPERLWNERLQRAARWYDCTSPSQVAQKRVTCRRAMVETREQCELISQRKRGHQPLQGRQISAAGSGRVMSAS